MSTPKIATRVQGDVPKDTVVVQANCIGCGVQVGFFAQFIDASEVPKGSNFAVKSRFSCEECGPRTAYLAIAETTGKAN